jgi:uncharacterized membrane protein YagU involved in acid resistance
MLKAGLLVGTLDIVAASLHYAIQTGGNPPWPVLQYIASGLFGQEAYRGGIAMMLAGLFFHYCIAFAFTSFFFWLYGSLRRYASSPIWIGVLYGLFVWAVMNLVVVPLSKIPPRPFTLGNVLINVVILVVCMGIPLAVVTNSFYKEMHAGRK